MINKYNDVIIEPITKTEVEHILIMLQQERLLDLFANPKIEDYINPIPSGLVLTGIVVSVSVTALMLSLTIRLYKRYHTLDLDEISQVLKREG